MTVNINADTVVGGADANWKDTPAKPVDENQYKFDFLAWQWIKVTQ